MTLHTHVRAGTGTQLDPNGAGSSMDPNGRTGG